MHGISDIFNMGNCALGLCEVLECSQTQRATHRSVPAEERLHFRSGDSIFTLTSALFGTLLAHVKHSTFPNQHSACQAFTSARLVVTFMHQGDGIGKCPNAVNHAPQAECVVSVQILRGIFPVVTYSNLLATAVLPFAISVNALGVKGCALVAAAARILTRILLLFGSTVFSIQLSEVMLPGGSLAAAGRL